MRIATLALRIAALGALLFAIGCSAKLPVNMPYDAVALGLSARDYKVTGHGKGKDCKQVLLGIQVEAPSYSVAHQQALAASGGKFLLNKRMYDGSEEDYLLVYQHCRYVEGTGVSF